MESAVLEIIRYQPAHQSTFEALNREWIETYFSMEQIDFEVLQHPEEHILKSGGVIFMAESNGELVGTVALKKAGDTGFELTKMAVDKRWRGRGIGERLAVTAITWAKDVGALKVILYSSTKLPSAIALYRKLGFREVPVDGPYKRSDIKMELEDVQGSKFKVE